MNASRKPLSNDRREAAKSDFTAKLEPLVEQYREAKAVSEETDGNESREAFDRIIEATVNAYRAATNYITIRRDVSSAVYDVVKKVLGDTLDEKRMLGFRVQLFREVAEFGTGDCGAEDKNKASAQHSMELIECELSDTPEMEHFANQLCRSGSIIMQPFYNAVRMGKIKVKDGRITEGKEEYFDPAVRELLVAACTTFQQLATNGNYSDSIEDWIAYYIESACEGNTGALYMCCQAALNDFRAHVEYHKQHLLDEQARKHSEITSR